MPSRKKVTRKKATKKATRKVASKPKAPSTAKITKAIAYLTKHSEEMRTSMDTIHSLMKPITVGKRSYGETVTLEIRRDGDGIMSFRAGCRNFSYADMQRVYDWLKPVCEASSAIKLPEKSA